MSREKTKISPDKKGLVAREPNRFLVLHNDEVNSFDFVIQSLQDVCEHSYEQAEQCALITHFKGKCDIKKGEFEELKPMKDKLLNRKLTATIE